MATTIRLYDDGNDVLRVEEVDAGGNVTRRAQGWVSALKNVVINDARDANGNRPADVPDPTKNRRAMTAAEQQTYATQLLNEANPGSPPPATPLASFSG